MFLPDNQVLTEDLSDSVQLSPLSKDAIANFTEVYKLAKQFLDGGIFANIKQSVERLIGDSLNLRKRLDKAKMGRILALAELSHRKALPQGFDPIYLFDEVGVQQEIDFDNQPSSEADQLSEIREERDRAKEQAHRYQQQLREFEQFTQLLLVGRILPKPLELNGLEKSPLLQVFGGARSLSEVHTTYRELRKAWHPDISPFSESETNARFHWLKQAYTTLVNNWSRFDPQNQDIPTERIEKLLNQQLRWNPESFWYWI